MEFFVSASSATIHIDDYGTPQDGEKTLVLLHGYLETMYIWSQFAELLKSKYRIVIMDLPGHGISSTAPSAAPNTMEYCAQVVKGVLDKLNISKSVIGGHSMGGFVAEVFAKMYPETVEKLILFNSHPYPDNPANADFHNREISVINSGKLETIASLSIPKMYYPDNLRKVDDKVCETVELCEMHDPQGIIASIKGMASRPDMSQWLSESQKNIPIMMICGDNDQFMSVEQVGKMHEQFPDVKLVVIEKTGHNSFIESPERCAELVTEFIG